MAISRETTRARYITPANSSIITSERAAGVSGNMSPRPTPDRVVKLRNSSSVQVRGASASSAALKLPGTASWQKLNRWAKAQASRVKVAPAAYSSSVVARWSAFM